VYNNGIFIISFAVAITSVPVYQLRANLEVMFSTRKSCFARMLHLGITMGLVHACRFL